MSMRVVFIGKSHPFSIRPLDAIAGSHEIVGLVESGARHARSQGTLARIAAEWKRRLGAPTGLEQRALQRGIPHVRLERGSVGPLNELLRATHPDLLVIASLSQLLPAATLAIPRLGAINLHPSLLPRYPGPFPILWQYLDFEKTFGVTVHKLDAQEDAGDILEQEPFDVAPGTPLAEVLERSTSIGARLMAKAVDDLAAGRSRPRPQSGPRGPRAREVHRHEPLIDWEGWPIERVWHAMLGTAPWLDPLRPISHAKRVWRVGAYERVPVSGRPGTLGKDEQGSYAVHPEGRIRLS